MPSLYDGLKFVVTDSSEKFLSGSQLIAILIQITRFMIKFGNLFQVSGMYELENLEEFLLINSWLLKDKTLFLYHY